MSSGCILVTGASGLIGRGVLRALLETGRNAIGIDLSRRVDQDRVYVADLCDIHRLHSLASLHDVDLIIHCGAVSGPMVMIDNPHAIVQANVVGTANVLELARIHGMRRVVFCSSTSVYGPTEEPEESSKGVPEETILRPTSVYGATKVASEQLLAAYKKQHGLDTVAVRLSWVYGPGRTTDCVIRTMLENAHRGQRTELAWGRDFPRQFIYVDDAVDALLTACDVPTCPAAAYTATGGSFHTIGEIAQIVRRVVGQADIDVAPGPDPLDDFQHRFDISAIARDLGFHPSRSLEDGIAAYSQWLVPNH